MPNVTNYERYSQRDHDKILDEFGVSWDTRSTFLGFVLCTSNGQRYLLANCLWGVKDVVENGVERTQQCFEKYKVSAGFNVDPQGPFDDFYILDPEEKSSIFKGNFTELIDELIKDDLFLQVAKTYGLTNTEYLRLSLTNEFPEDKTRPISTIT